MLPNERPRVLILADECNPEWPSLPIVAYKYAKALSELCDVTVATQVRNRENISKLHPDGGEGPLKFVFINTEYIAGPIFRLASFLRGNPEVAWSTGMVLNYLPYIEFERQAWRRFREKLKAGAFDIVHRVSPMSPTMPSYIAGLGPQPFVLGPLNGNLDWPAAFADEQKREKEGLRRLRDLYKYLPFVGRTWRNAKCVLAAFQHTIDDLDAVPAERIVMFPEVGYDEAIFHPPAARESDPAAPVQFLYAGRLVPYKLPEVAIRAFAGSPKLAGHVLHIVGDGPERPRLEAIVAELGAADRIRFAGRQNQMAVADFMRRCDVFVFPSIRELGAGVVVEAMACGLIPLVVDYGGPADLVAADRGVKVPLADRDSLIAAFRAEMERRVEDRGTPAETAMRAAAVRYAQDGYRWSRKAAVTRDIYRCLINGRTDFPRPY